MGALLPGIMITRILSGGCEELGAAYGHFSGARKWLSPGESVPKRP